MNEEKLFFENDVLMNVLKETLSNIDMLGQSQPITEDDWAKALGIIVGYVGAKIGATDFEKPQCFYSKMLGWTMTSIKEIPYLHHSEWMKPEQGKGGQGK